MSWTCWPLFAEICSQQVTLQLFDAMLYITASGKACHIRHDKMMQCSLGAGHRPDRAPWLQGANQSGHRIQGSHGEYLPVSSFVDPLLVTMPARFATAAASVNCSADDTMWR